MDASPMSAVDMLLERHRSSLVTAGTTVPGVPLPGAGASPSERATTTSRKDQRVVTTRTENSSSANMEEPTGIWRGERVTPLPPQAHPLVGMPQLQQQALSPPAASKMRPEQQPGIMRHEAPGLYDTLQFRLRTNDRDLQGILSRSTERLSLSEQQPPPAAPSSPMPRGAGGALTFLPSTPSAPTAPEGTSLQTPPDTVPPPEEFGEPATHLRSPTAISRPVAGLPQLSPLDALVRDAATLTPESTMGIAGVSGHGDSRLSAHALPEQQPASAQAFTRSAPPDGSVRGALPSVDAATERAVSSRDELAAPATMTTPPAASAANVEVRTAEGAGGADEELAPAMNQKRDEIGEGNRKCGPPGGVETTQISTMPAPPARKTTSVAAAGPTASPGPVATPPRPTTLPATALSVQSGGGGSSGGTDSAIRESSSKSGQHEGDEGLSSTPGHARGSGDSKVIQSINRVLGTPPRLPRPLANGLIVGAAKEAAKWLAVDDRTWHQAKKFMDDCIADCPSERILQRRKLTAEQWRESKVAAIEATLEADPSLATCRHINRSAFPMDGWTPLHAAAARGNIEFVKALLKIPGVSVWSVDLQGRTALALAAEGGHLQLCLLLKERMETESADTVVGINAPVDLAGRTPLAWSVRSRARNKQVEGHLYAAGDASVCPATPAALRSGGGKTAKGATGRTGAVRGAAESLGEGLPCGYAEAPGWRIDMEDAMCRHNPVPVADPESGRASPVDPTSMFGIFDGHGGAFTSKFVAEALVKCLQDTAGWKSGDRDLPKLCPALMQAFVSCDAMLAREPRMVVKELENPSGGKRFEARDGSGSTAVVALVTSAHVIVANAGDSRAVLVMVARGRGADDGSGKPASGDNARTGAASSAVKSARALGSSADAGGQDGKAADDGMADGDENSSASPEPQNDSVRLEDQEEADEDGGEDFDGASQLRKMLEAMMLGADLSAPEVEDEKNSVSDDVRGVHAAAGEVEVTAMSRDHTAKDRMERERVTAAGGKAFEVQYKEEDGTESTAVRTSYDTEVEGQSVVPTRGFGDLYYKQKKDESGNLLPPADQVVTVCPEIMVHERGSSGKEELLLLACDGVWDVFDDQDAGTFLVSQLEGRLAEVTGEDLAHACDAVVKECLRRGSTDNITAMAISLGSGPAPVPSAVGGRVLFSDGR